MKIAIVCTDGGVAYHRLVGPFSYIGHHAGIRIKQINALDIDHLDMVEDCDIIVINRLMPPDPTSTVTIKELQRRGKKVWVDVDDYWRLHPGHLVEKLYKDFNTSNIIVEAITLADVVTCTHEHLAKKIRHFNKKVRIVPNAINTQDAQWAFKPINPNPDTFGWMGSSAHAIDVALLYRPMKKYWDDSSLKFRMIIAGHTPGAHDVWMNFQKHLTGNMKAPRNRVGSMGALPWDEYAAIIDSIDIGLVPLADNEFNRCKSELKVLEFAAKGKAVIVSNIHPYTNICNETNSFLCNEPMDFYRHLKKIERNPAIALEKAIQLNLDASRLYNWEKINNIRVDIINKL